MLLIYFFSWTSHMRYFSNTRPKDWNPVCQGTRSILNNTFIHLYNKYLKKAGRYNSWNVMNITTKRRMLVGLNSKSYNNNDDDDDNSSSRNYFIKSPSLPLLNNKIQTLFWFEKSNFFFNFSMVRKSLSINLQESQDHSKRFSDKWTYSTASQNILTNPFYCILQVYDPHVCCLAA